MLSRVRVENDSLVSGLDWKTSTFLRCSLGWGIREGSLSSGELDREIIRSFLESANKIINVFCYNKI